ncbi:hypothetical protein SAMD00019534_018270 [Acytostelium subglobosum LB1]|uniref:hypothetical protein n=1 Tax=Acytostelium subglobosum LB1 TaxID=1410327 RepID=UPI0006450C66|nr:hypothetical protein SAMD00019534_018270 [Acytostelium subglobosum LB1]GAM18652.1 hypothetical protein SAMD00019534_018270 [Acytostelium subglobosum LB1]|eukprot:XP_012757872.1 hypothetical protein SAMD00019534_018270 [Acytostelium subglobosum LB1]
MTTPTIYYYDRGVIFRVLINRFLIRTIIDSLSWRVVNRRTLQHRINELAKYGRNSHNDEPIPKHCFRYKYHHWTDAESMFKYRHHGLLRDRIKRNLYINFTHSTPLIMFNHGDVDKETFMDVYLKYQRYFTDVALLRYAVQANNKLAVLVLWHQTSPVIMDRNFSLLIDAVQSGSFIVLGFLLDSSNDQMLGRFLDTVKSKYMHHFYSSASTIRYVLDANHFPPALINLVKEEAYSFSQCIISTCDQQLIDQLLIEHSRASTTRGHPRLRGVVELLPNASPANQLAHIEMMFMPVPNDDRTWHERSLKHLESSKSTAHSILKYKSLAPTHSARVNDCMGDEQRMVFVKLGNIKWEFEHSHSKVHIKSHAVIIKYLTHQYVLTGDCMLIPFIIEQPGHGCDKDDISDLIQQIIRHGNLNQIIVALEVLNNISILDKVIDDPRFRMGCLQGDMYNSFLEADDLSNSLDVIKYLNENKVVQSFTMAKPNIVLHIQQLEFLMSNENKIFPTDALSLRLVLMEMHHIDYVLQVNPSFFQPATHSDYYGCGYYHQLNIIVYSFRQKKFILGTYILCPKWSIQTLH